MTNCTKKSYGDKNKAHVAMRTIQKAGKTMRAYQCKDCYKWHLTSDLKSYEHEK